MAQQCECVMKISVYITLQNLSKPSEVVEKYLKCIVINQNEVD